MTNNPARKRIRRVETGRGAKRISFTLDQEDYSAVYPGMLRFVLSTDVTGETTTLFRTNTYEYSPMDPLAAETEAVHRADEWEAVLRHDPERFMREVRDMRSGQEPVRSSASVPYEVVIIQGSPRPDGNCGIVTGWVADAAGASGATVRVIYPHDMDIHCCIGCYQCYNTGSCVFDDDMKEIIAAVRETRILAICSPVYTNTVPGSLKLLIDRMQAYHAERLLIQRRTGQKGLIFSVAGRKGEHNFACVTNVLSSFMENIGIRPAGTILFDNADVVRDIRTRPQLEKKVKDMVVQVLGEHH